VINMGNDREVTGIFTHVFLFLETPRKLNTW